MSGKEENLFPTLGEIASRTDALREVEDDDVRLNEGAPALIEQEEGEEREMQEIESLCMRCHEQGVTRMLLTNIPYFKEVVVSSFRCEKCGHRDTEIQSAGEIQPKGVTYTVHLRNRTDLDRQIVKSNFASVLIPDIQLTIPAGRGQLSTVEGLIRDTIRDLNISQPVRRVMDPETGKKIDEMLTKLRDYIQIEEGEEDEDGGVGNYDDDDEDEQKKSGKTAEELEKIKLEKPFVPFTMTIDDPSGNSFFQFLGGTSDPQWNMRAYNRTLEQNVQLGLVAAADKEDDGENANMEAGPSIPKDHKLASMAEFEKVRSQALGNRADGTVVPDEVFSFPSTCSSCGYELETLMQQVNIPYFQNIIIMATNCYACGYRDNEIKSGAAISDKGKKIILKVEDEEDLSRDLLKSDTAGLEIPEIDLILQPGTLGGRFTTVEGLLNEIYNELSTKVFRTGDSTTSGVGQIGLEVNSDERKFEDFLKGLKECMSASKPFTLIIDDPVSNSYLQNLYAPDPDPNMTIEEYERSHDQNEELGLNDVVLEGYNPEAEGTLVNSAKE